MRQTWPIKKFAEASVEIIDGDRGKNYPKQNDFQEEGFCLFLNTGNVTTNGFLFSNCQFITEEKDEILRKGKLSRNDVIMTTRGTIGNLGFYNDNVPFDHIRINSGMVIFRTNPRKLLPDFLYHYLRSTMFYRQTQAIRSGAAQPQLPIRDIKTIGIPVPPPEAQENISDILSTYDGLIENNRRRIKLLEEASRQLYKEWFVRFRFPGHETVKIINGIPEGWEKTNALDAMEVLSGGTPKTTNPDFWDGNIPFYTPKDSTDSIYALNTEKTLTELGINKCSSKNYPKNTLFITARGTVGKLNLAQVSMAMNQSCYALVGKHPLNQFFLYFSLDAAIAQFKGRAVGSVFDAIIRDTFKIIPFTIPPKMIIDQFTDFVSPMIQQVDALSLQIENLSKGRDLLLPKLMSGEIAV